MQYIIGNLKMNLLSSSEREKYLTNLHKELAGKKTKNTEIILCPPFVHLEVFGKGKSKKVKVGAQNMFSEDKGSYTGEISPLMLKNFGCEYVILGHSERRKYFLENNEEINLKIIAALKNGLRPILCVGETKAEKEAEKTLEVVSRQMKESLAEIPRGKVEQIIVAYEPVWAVGSDLTPTSNEIMEAKVLIKKILVEMFGERFARNVALVYGGSVNAENVQAVCLEPGMDGVLVGRDSLNPREFGKIIERLNK
jgi:triosephosphate isomerase (TIM)